MLRAGAAELGEQKAKGTLSMDISSCWARKKKTTRIFPVVLSGKRRGNGHQLKYEKFHVKLRRKFYCKGQGVSKASRSNFPEMFWSLQPWNV